MFDKKKPYVIRYNDGCIPEGKTEKTWDEKYYYYQSCDNIHVFINKQDDEGLVPYNVIVNNNLEVLFFSSMYSSVCYYLDSIHTRSINKTWKLKEV